MRYCDADRLLATSSPAGLAHVTSRGAWVPFEHLVVLNDHLLAAAAGQLPRLIVSMPPQHGKSELVSRYAPAWLLGRFPDRRVILASYEAGFARTWGRKARDLLEEHGPALFGVTVADGSSAAHDWEIAGRQGGMVTAGVGGAITGRGAQLLIVDDPVKNQQEAASQVIRDRAWDWWLSTARTRLRRGAAVVLVMTRWNEDDLAGRMLQHASQGGDEWAVLELPALAQPSDGQERDLLGRVAGEPLCPALHDLSELEQTRRSVGAYFWAAMYQQQPRPAEGLLFKRPDFRYWRSEPGLYVLQTEQGLRPVGVEHCRHFQTVDVAASAKQSADYTVVSTWAVTPDRDLILVDVDRQHFDLVDVGGMIRRNYDHHHPAFVSVERLGHGLTVIQEQVRAGLPIRRLEADTDKVSRALVAVARYEEHRVYHPRGAPWLGDWEAELLAFPNAAHDDQVDTAAYAARELPNVAAGRRRRREKPGQTEMGGMKHRAL